MDADVNSEQNLKLMHVTLVEARSSNRKKTTQRKPSNVLCVCGIGADTVQLTDFAQPILALKKSMLPARTQIGTFPFDKTQEI